MASPEPGGFAALMAMLAGALPADTGAEDLDSAPAGESGQTSDQDPTPIAVETILLAQAPSSPVEPPASASGAEAMAAAGLPVAAAIAPTASSGPAPAAADHPGPAAVPSPSPSDAVPADTPPAEALAPAEGAAEQASAAPAPLPSAAGFESAPAPAAIVGVPSPAAGPAAAPPPPIIIQTAPQDVPAPAEQVGRLLIAQPEPDGPTTLSLRLDPPELGSLDITVEGSAATGLAIEIRAVEPAALAALQRDQDSLQRMLDQAGLGGGARSLSFSLADRGTPDDRRGAPPPPQPDAAALPAARRPPPSWAARRSAIDILA